MRYNSPVKKGIAVGIGKLYFENKGYNYNSHPDLPKAELLMINANSSDTNTYDYSEFIGDYYYQAPIDITPFDTEYNGKYKAIKMDLNLTALFDQEGCLELDFSHLIFSVPNPSYELTVSEVLILEESYKPSEQYGSMDERVWQYTEVEIFTASENPEEDSYQLTLEEDPLFYPDVDWLDYLNIFDEDGNYYTAGILGDDHQLLFEPATNTFTWNPSFNQYPEYFGMEFEEPLLIEANKTLYFGYVTNTSWAEPILIEAENIDLDSIRVIYDYNYLLKPEFYDWYANTKLNLSTQHSYENIAYSFKEESEYEVVQYYYEVFTVYNEAPQYTHTFDIGELSFADIVRDTAVTRDLQTYLRKAAYKFRIGKNTINALLSTIEMMYQIELFNIRDRGSMIGYYDKVLAYDEALNDIYKYIGAYYLGYSKKHVQNKDNLEGLINEIREFFVGQHENIQSSPYSLEVHIDIDSLDSLLEYPDLVDHLKRVDVLKGFPRSVLDVYSDTTGISSFNKRLVGFSSDIKQKIKAEFIDKIIADELVTEYKYGEGLIPDFLKDLFKNSQGSGKGSGGSTSHEDLAIKMQKSQYYIGSEVNVWISLEDDHYRGHIDLLLYDAKTNTIYVCDYKPDLSMSDRGSYNFINSVPQVAGYGLLLQKQGNLKVKNVIFNNKEAWVFDPNEVLDPINEFMAENNEGWYPPWEAFSRYL